ncbi:phosphotransferase [Curtobacterium sp. MCPF17_002]|uniref:phosphotransferase n=1 Tax=Curtobacterium sp. MCPF17_002 TaxID=2175645 RepID=UPI000DA9168C|nr:phosphotransferase [Curtobacterium sp. MCPF17_002]WIB75843.1 phosphotransferase [Curtobacterium sp. MCPF17_002]
MSSDQVGLPWFDDVLRSVGASASRAEPLPGGAVNHTYRASRDDAGTGAVVLRFPVDPLREDEFPVEAWAARQAGRAAGIPVATPLVHGVERGVPFSVSEYVPHDPRPVEHPWTWLGTVARTVGTVPLDEAPSSLFSRFGTDLAQAWSAHVAYNAAALGPGDRLRRDGAYGADGSAEAIRGLLDGLAAQRFDFGLAHGDLAPRNLVSRGPDRPPVLIDWGAAETGPTPWTDARRVFEWAFVDGSITRQEYDEFAVAAGLASDADRRTLASMTTLHLLDVTRWALANRPDLYDEYVERCRAGLERLRGR